TCARAASHREAARSSCARSPRVRASAASSTSRRPRQWSRSSACASPTAIQLLHVRSSLVPNLTAEDLERNSFYDLLESRYDVAIIGGTQTVEPTVTNEEESQALGVPLH